MTLLLLALGLSLDAFAAALSHGAGAPSNTGPGAALRIGLAFGAAQAVMPLFGWGLGLAFASVIQDVDHWIAFVLLALIGVHMIREALAGADHAAQHRAAPTRGWTLAGAAVATSIDAAAAGVTLAFLEQPILLACGVIGAVTLVLSAVGVLIGRVAGLLAGRNAQILGGVVLIGIGARILIGHTLFGE